MPPKATSGGAVTNWRPICPAVSVASPFPLSRWYRVRPTWFMS